jgi:phosphatidylinositol alpha-mannosyltransferase
VKVGLVCPYDWSVAGGVRTHIAGLAAELRNRGIGAEVIAPASKPEPGIFVAGRPVPVPSNGSIARICFSRHAARRIAGRLADGEIDLLHLHEPLAPSLSLLALTKDEKLPKVASFHAARDGSLGYGAFRPLLKRWMNRIDERVAVSRAARAFVGRYFPGDYALIPNGIDASRFDNAKPDPELEPLRPFVLFVGRPERRKGFPVLVRAMEELRKDFEVQLVTTTEAPPDSPPWLVSLGAVSDERLPGVFAAADVYCAPSLGGESFGLVLIEAMAAGAPVVASDIPGYREAAGDAAFWAAPGDAAWLAVALRKVLGDKGVAEGLRRRGQERAKKFEWRVLADQVLEIYRLASEHRMIVTQSKEGRP